METTNRARTWALVLQALTISWGVTTAAAQPYTEAAHLHGVHFFADQNANGGVASPGYYSDVEALLGDSGGPVNSANIAGDAGGWLLDVAMTDVDCSNDFFLWAWQGGVFGPTDKTLPGYQAYAFERATKAQKHSPIVRIQPFYGRNVPYDKSYFGIVGVNPSDPYTVANFAADCRLVANLLKDTARYYVVGNEVNIEGENHRYTQTTGGLNLYEASWQPSPEQYAAVYLAVRDSMVTATLGSAGTPVALLQPTSPGIATPPVNIDGNEFLARSIEWVNAIDPARLDGFAVHSYAEPGGSNFGVDGFMDTIREQLCIIGQLGHGSKPVFLTEYNKDMPDNANHLIGVEFAKRSHQALHAWNTGSGGIIPALGNQNIVGTNWFLYPAAPGGVFDGFNRQSLLYWKAQTAMPDANNNVWYAFQNAAQQRYPRGAVGGGGTWPVASQWWRDAFNGGAVDSTPALPDWQSEVGSGGTVGLSGGRAVFRGNGNTFGNAYLYTKGYAFTNFAMRAIFTMTNAARANPGGGSPEANFDIRIREGSSGYALTFFSSAGTDARAGRIILRQKGPWSQVGSFNVAVPGGINTGDSFDVRIKADGQDLTIRAFKNGSAAPVMTWTVAGNPLDLHAGWVRFGSYGLAEAQLEDVSMGGVLYDLDSAFSAAAEDSHLYE